jgi:hypothetical protein
MKRSKDILFAILQRVRALTWVDLFGVCIFLGILSVAFFFFLRKADYAYVTLRVSQSDTLNTYNDIPPVWFIDKIQPGLKETDGLGRESILIEGVHRYRSNDLNQDFYVDLKVKSIFNARTGQYSYNGSTLLVGSFQSFKLQTLQLTGVIVDIRGKDTVPEEKYFIVKGFINPAANDDQFTVANTVGDGIRNYLADTLQKGLTITDVDGQIIAEVQAVTKRPGKRQFVAGRELVSVPDPDRQHVEMTLRVKTIKIGDAYFFRKESPMIINGTMYLPFSKSNVIFTITDLRPE